MLADQHGILKQSLILMSEFCRGRGVKRLSIHEQFLDTVYICRQK